MLPERAGEGGLKAKVSGRSKSVYSIHRKMESMVNWEETWTTSMTSSHQVLVDRVDDCYRLGIVHQYRHPIPADSTTTLPRPRRMAYRRSHHRDVFQCPLEAGQTYEMHESAEYGLSAHWVYKEGVNRTNSASVSRESASCWSGTRRSRAQRSSWSW